MAEDLDPVLTRIEQKLAELEDATRILLALRLMRDGHATDWPAAIRLARDLDAVRALYPEAYR